MPLSWHWEFGDGAQSSLQEPAHTYTAPGVYDVTLTVTGAGSATSSKTREQYIVVSDAGAPPAVFSATPTSGAAPLEVAFTDLSSAAVTAWFWDFGDGATSTEKDPRHVYDSPGSFTVALTVISPAGQASVVQEDLIAVASGGPTAAFDASPLRGSAPLVVQFSDASSGAVEDWSWDFGDGSVATGSTVSHTYSAPGVYTVSLTVTGPDGSDTSVRADLIEATGKGVVGVPDYLWIAPSDLDQRPMTGPAWTALLEAADEPAGAPNVADQDDNTDIRALARALVYARTGIARYGEEARELCLRAIGTEVGGTTLALSRNLLGYVIAADLAQLDGSDDARFRAWLELVLDEDLAGRSLRSTHEDRPNNWGTHAGASRAAVAIYLGDETELARVAQVFRGFLGDTSAYAGFKFGELWWQADPARPVGINPAGAQRNGQSIDGVLPDDQRRGGPFSWPPPQENYVYEALQGVVVQATLLNSAGYDAWNWSDQALLRAMQWLHDEALFPAVGDDTWIPHLVNHAYATGFPAPVPSEHGKNMGFTDWTHGF